MSLRSSLLKSVEAARKLSGPAFADIRVNQVTVRTRTWSGAFVGDGTSTDSDLVLPPHYPVRYVTTREVSSSVGAYETSDLWVDHITPSDGGSVGYTRAQLNPATSALNVEIIYVITGTHGGNYNLVECRTERPFTFGLVLRRRQDTP